MTKQLQCGVGLFLAACGAAVAQPQIDLSYCVTEVSPGLYEYQFTLKPNENWQAGMAWRWLIFGDEPGTCCGGSGISPLTNWNGSSTVFPVGPWTSFSSSGGGHNGPTFASVLEYWTPQSATETLTWSGTSTANLGQGQMKWSTLAGTLGGAIAANWTVATLTSCNGGTCYANCDESTTSPVLNVADFSCFLSKFAAAHAYANCDGSTTAPVLNVADFSCFLSKFAAGCP